MQRLQRWLLTIAALAAAAGLGVEAAQAHPHVWITARSELLYAPDGTVTGVRHAWKFDDMFSAYAIQGLETKQKGVYSREDLAPLAQTNVESLKDFAYFTYAKAEGKKYKFTEPVDYYLDYKDAVLTLHFTLPLKAPVMTKQLAVEVFDPSYFIDFSFENTDPVKLVGAPAGCEAKFQRPNDGTADAAKLGEDNFLSGDNSNYGAMFANKIAVTCP
uniref:ABC transporter substrate-binding protein n=1 Tax=Rhodopseudomonas palustris (strain BisA53) TaxID=316055 RepID=Q07H60_RHOP5